MEKLPDGQLGLFNEAEASATEEPETAPGTEVAAHRRATPKRAPLPDALPRIDVEHPLPDHERTCPHHGVELERFGEVVSEQLDIIPAQVRVLRHVRGKYRCPHCEGHLRTAPMPAQPLPKSLASPGLLAHVATAKYADALPLYRQHQQLKRIGVDLSRTTLATWMVRAGALVVPLLNLLRDELLDRPYLLMDETTVQVLKEPGKSAQSKSQLWAQMSAGPDPPIVLFEYDPTRSGDVPKRLLAGFTGALPRKRGAATASTPTPSRTPSDRSASDDATGCSPTPCPAPTPAHDSTRSLKPPKPAPAKAGGQRTRALRLPAPRVHRTAQGPITPRGRSPAAHPARPRHPHSILAPRPHHQSASIAPFPGRLHDGDNAGNPGGEIGSNTRYPGSDVGNDTGSSIDEDTDDADSNFDNDAGNVGGCIDKDTSDIGNGTGDRRTKTYLTAGGIAITRTARTETRGDAIASLAAALDEGLGVLLTSSFEYPGRYTRWDIGFCDPALAFTGRQRGFEVRACNERGAVLLPAVAAALEGCDAVADLETDAHAVTGTVRASGEWFPEELRSKQPTLFSVVRTLIDLFRSPEDAHLGLYGAFGYELAFQFDPIRLAMPRDGNERNLVLFLPDDVLVVDHRRETATRSLYEFEVADGSTADLPRTGRSTAGLPRAGRSTAGLPRAGRSIAGLPRTGRRTAGLPRTGSRTPYVPAGAVERECDHAPGEYAATVRAAIEAFRRGDLFEVVPGQTFFEPCPAPPSELYRRLKERNPAPYGALMHLGEREYLVAASPEMYVRVEGRRIETCPISGTIARGANAIGDARQIRTLLNSEKEESELTMCTDVDRNDKSRVCEAESVRVIGRRQIEMYSRLIHTVDHVEGRLREGYDALDGFLAHTWAVTVTGAPKQHAIQFIEDHERSPRRWYGGAIGFLGFDGNMNTGLTLRTVRVKDGVAEVRAGATLLFGSDPEGEEAETRLKASALLDAIRRGDRAPGPGGEAASGTGAASRTEATPRTEAALRAEAGADRPGAGRRVMMIDHEDSFVHTLAGYFRRTGAEVATYRAGFPRRRIAEERPDLVLLSPGPGRPEDFGVGETIAAALAAGIPLFGVCLGLQGIVEYHGGRLSVLPAPMHGKPSMVNVRGGRLFDGLPERFEGGRYHSLYADRDTFPDALEITAESDEGIVMAVEHPELPVAAVQLHPESILTLDAAAGLAVVMNVMRGLGGADP